MKHHQMPWPNKFSENMNKVRKQIVLNINGNKMLKALVQTPDFTQATFSYL